MFVYPLVSHSFILVLAAAIPALFLMVKVYKSDRLEPESPRLLTSLILAGIISAFIALVEEMVLQSALDYMIPKGTVLYDLLMYFVVVAVSEESSKYFMMKRKTWKNPEFDCRFDGVVYAVFTSLGFALWENIQYVLTYGMSTALIRAVTAIPGHACFGVFMGVYYALAKDQDYSGNKKASRIYRKLAVLVPVLFHGTYDFIATKNTTMSFLIFVLFVLVMFSICYRLIGNMAKTDRYMTWHIIR